MSEESERVWHVVGSLAMFALTIVLVWPALRARVLLGLSTTLGASGVALRRAGYKLNQAAYEAHP